MHFCNTSCSSAYFSVNKRYFNVPILGPPPLLFVVEVFGFVIIFDILFEKFVVLLLLKIVVGEEFGLFAFVVVWKISGISKRGGASSSFEVVEGNVTVGILMLEVVIFFSKFLGKEISKHFSFLFLFLSPK